jgi:ADP-heptose:LPS heptosyltransferase
MPHDSSPFKNAGKIGIIRKGSLGEFFLAYPSLAAIRKTYPEAELVYFGDEWHQKFLSDRPEIVSRVERLPLYAPYAKNGKSKETKDFVARLKKEKFDFIVQMNDDGYDTNLLISDIGPATSAGFAAVDAQPLDITIPYVPFQNETVRNLELIEAIGISDFSMRPLFPTKRKDHAEYSDIYKSDGRDYVILHPGANDPRRRWPPEYFSMVGDWLVGQGYRVIITSSIIEYEVAESVLYAMKEPAEAMVGVLSLPALVALLEKARLVISNDTGPLHAARSVGTPTLGIYWALHLGRRGPLFSARDRAVVSLQIECPTCNKPYDANNWPIGDNEGPCEHKRSMVDSVQPEGVIEAADKLLLDTVSTISL